MFSLKIVYNKHHSLDELATNFLLHFFASINMDINLVL